MNTTSWQHFRTVAAIVGFLMAAVSAKAADPYKLSGSVDGTGTFHVDDDLDVYVNGTLIYSDHSAPGSPDVRQPITVTASVGDTLHFEVRDTYGICTRMTRLILTDAVGRFAVADPGFNLGCGRPAGNQGVSHMWDFVIPSLADLPPYDDTLLPGSAFAGPVPGPFDGLLYGVTYDGGDHGQGAIYSFDPALSLVTLLHSFDGATEGIEPYDDMTLDPVTGKFYGTTARGGPSNAGTVFEFDPATNGFATLRNDFAGFYQPAGPLVKSGGFLYGALSYNNGAVFRMATDGSGFTIIHPMADFGSLPLALTLGPDGLLYGVGIYGGGVVCNPSFSTALGCGTVFRLKPVLPGDTDEQFQNLYVFQNTTPVFKTNYPQGRLIYGSDGWLYGTTYYYIFKLNPQDANPASTFQFIWTQGGGTSLSAIEGADHRLYAANYDGGTNRVGSIVSLDRDGTNTITLHEFSLTSGSTSYGPYGRMYRNAVGTVFGTTEYTLLPPEHGVIFAISGTGVTPPPPGPPVLTNVAVTPAINENDIAFLSGQISDPDPASTFALTVTWGDASAPQTINYAAGTTSFTLTHKYLDDDPSGTSSDSYTLNLTLTNNHSLSDIGSTSLTVNNVAPGLTPGTVTPLPIVVGVATTMSFTLADVGTLDTHTVVFGWGDGTADTTVNLAAGVLAFDVTHTFVVSGTLTVSASWSDDDLGSNSASIPITVNPAPSLPVLSNLMISAALFSGPPNTIYESDLAALSGGISDADPASTFTLTVDWADGSAPQTFTYPAGTTSFRETHFYADDNPSGTSSDTHPINLTLTNSHGDSVTGSTLLTVYNSSPAFVSPFGASPSPITAGQSTTLTGNFVDPGTVDTHTVVIDWGDLSPVTTLNLAVGVTTFSATHVYTSSLVFHIGATVSDDDGGSASISTSITVNPPTPPVLSNILISAALFSGPPNTLFESDLAALSGLMSDADPAATLGLSVNWGDGSGLQAFTYPAGTRSFRETHQYLDDDPSGTSADTYLVTLTLTDSHGGRVTGSTFLTVYNSSPTFVGSFGLTPSPITAGQSTTLTGNFVDSGTVDTHTVIIDWGDSTSLTTLNLPAGEKTFSATHRYTSSLVFTVGATVSDDDGGLASVSTSITVNPLPPAAPSNLAAVAVTKNEIDLSWRDNSNSETEFEIERCDGNGKCTVFALVGRTNANDTVFFDTGLAPSSNHVYRVRAANAGGSSAYSNTASGRTPKK